jgi:flagellar motor switch protein FliM
MPEILSQAEIDALLSSVEEEEKEKSEIEIFFEDKKKIKKRPIKKYDFTSPDKFSKDHLRTLQMIHDNFARLVNSTLSAYLRSVIQVNLVSISEESYEEFLKSLPNPTVLAVFSLLPLEGTAILEINPNIMFTMFERLMGSKNISSPPSLGRELTDIEQSITENLFSRLLNSLKDAWANIYSFNPRIVAIETNPGFAQIVSPNDRVASVIIEIKIAEIGGIMNLCLPHLVLEPILPKLSTQFLFTGIKKSTTSESKEILKKRLEKAVIPLIVELGNTTLSLAEVLHLKTGDVIRLDTSPSSKLKVKIGEKIKFYAQPGVIGDRICIQITGRAEEGGRDIG